MSDRVQRFQLPQDQFLSWSFLSFHETGNLNPRPGTNTRRYLTFWARNAIYHSLRAAGLLPGDEVLVPAYVCRVVPEAVTGYGARAVFYHVGRNCHPDFSDLESKINTRTRAVIAVHYFGFPQPIGNYRELCTRRGLFLIEDCAHVLRSKLNGQLLGSFGDASVFSLRKFYPLYDGGELILNSANRELNIDWCRENALLTLKIAKDMVDQIAFRGNGLAIRIFRRLITWLKTSVVSLQRSTKRVDLTVEKTSSTFDLGLINHPMSFLSRIIFNHSDALAIYEKRRANYLFLQRELDRLRTLRFLVETLPEEVCPWVFPLFFEGEPNACTTLRELGIPAVTWDGVRPSGLEWRLFPDEDLLYRGLIFLPVHQNLTAKDLRRIVDAVGKVQSDQVGCAQTRES
jgi:perosamine synthetase